MSPILGDLEKGIFIYSLTHQMLDANYVPDTFLGLHRTKQKKVPSWIWHLGEENKIVSKSLAWHTGLSLCPWDRKFMSAVEKKKVYSAFGILNLKFYTLSWGITHTTGYEDIAHSIPFWKVQNCYPRNNVFQFSGAGDNKRSQSTDQVGKLTSKNDLQVHTWARDR